MNDVQTGLKCKPNVKRCKRFVFAAHSPLLHPNTLTTKAISHFQADHILTRFVFPPLNFDKVLNKLVASTRSPRGRFTAENSWRLLESRLLKRRSMKRFWMRTASAAAVVLLCVTSWAAYQFLYVAPQREAIPTEAIHTTEETQVIHSVLTFDQQPLQEIVRQLSETFRTDIRIEGDSLKNYHMTATFREGESLTEILDLLKDAGNFTYKKENNTIILTTKLN